MRPTCYYLLFFSLLACIVYESRAQGREELIKKNIAVFYPANFDSVSNLPSFILQKEYAEIGKPSSKWKIRPVFYKSAGKNCVAFPLKDKNNVSLYGSGEVTGSLIRNNKSIQLWNTDNWNYLKDNGRRLYQSHPWVLGVYADGSAFGIIADNTWKQELILKDSIKFESEGPAFRVIVITGNSPQEVLKDLSDLTGRMELPPLWALGYQQCRWSYEPDKRVIEIADGFRSHKIPCDVIWMDIDYMDHFKVFTFDSIKFPSPENLNNYLHNKGYKSIWMIDPGIKVEKGYSVYEQGTKGDHWVKNKKGEPFVGKVWPGECCFPDFTKPSTQQWWSGLYKNYMINGIDGVWNDMNEPSVFEVASTTMPEDNIHEGGNKLAKGSHLRYHNVYGTLMIKYSRDGILKVNPDKRPFVLSRSGFLGSHRYGATWTGDNKASSEHMKMSIPMILNLGLSGQPFSGADIGGYAGTTTPELFGQWIAIGAFYPFARGHAEKATNDKEPWAFGPEVEQISRTAINRRYRLLPYLYTLFYEASVNGLPVMRPVFFSDIQDTTLRKEDQAFLLGNDLLIVPKWANNPSLPKGNWRNVSIAGENSKDDHYQPDIKIKEGTVIPLGKIIQNTTEYQSDSLTLLISLNKAGKAYGKIYIDKGEGFGYKNGEYALLLVSAEQKKGKLNVAVKNQAGKLVNPQSFKIELVTDKGVISSDWQKGKHITVDL
jgi:alpha-glucosidase